MFIEERNNTWNTPYLFNAKELDEETGLYYYGARYYDPRISIWLSTDPLQEKYPSISTYAYCALNPVLFVDPTGTDVEITGDKSAEATSELQKSVANELKLTRNEKTNKLSYEVVTSEPLSEGAKKLVEAIDNSKVIVKILASDTYETTSGESYFGGAFMGGIYYSNAMNQGNGESVTANQEVNPIILSKMDEHFKKPGASMLHEVLEAYLGGVDGLQKQKGYSNSLNDYDHYKSIHDATSVIAPQSGDLYSTYYADNGARLSSFPVIGGREDIWVSNPDGGIFVLHSRNIRPIHLIMMENKIKPIVRKTSLSKYR